MKVIYAGYPKTGTKTMHEVFKRLGYKTIYDIMENYEYLNDDWNKIYAGKGTVEDFRRMFKDVDVVMDSPCCYFWEEILEAFPEAKVLFGYRDDEQWYKSFKSQVDSYERIDMKLQVLLSPTFRSMGGFLIGIQNLYFGLGKQPGPFGFNLVMNEMMCRKSYRMHNAYVLNNAPKDKLHVVDFKQGWEPICKFLEVPVPELPFPHKNKNAGWTQELVQEHHLFRRVRYESYVVGSLIICLIALAVFMLTGCISTP